MELDRTFRSVYVDGSWRDAGSNRSIDVHNPSTGNMLAFVGCAGAADVRAATAAGAKAFEAGPWPRLNHHERSAALLRMADVVERHRDELARLQSLEVGLPLAHSAGIVGTAVTALRYYACWATKFAGKTHLAAADTFAYSVKQPS